MLFRSGYEAHRASAGTRGADHPASIWKQRGCLRDSDRKERGPPSVICHRRGHGRQRHDGPHREHGSFQFRTRELLHLSSPAALGLDLLPGGHPLRQRGSITGLTSTWTFMSPKPDSLGLAGGQGISRNMRARSTSSPHGRNRHRPTFSANTLP